MKIFKHSGDLGDIIYSLPTIKLKGGGVLCLDTSGGITDEYCKKQCLNGQTKFNKNTFNFIKPLLEQQNYIKDCREYILNEKIDVNLDEFRMRFFESFTRSKTKNLIDLHLQTFNLSPWDYNKSWLTVPDEIKLEKPIVICRSPRYQSAFSVLQGMRSTLINNCIFVGLEKEHEYFEWTFDLKIPYYKVNDALEMAKIIKGCDVFISNATFAMSLAVGLGHQKIIHEFDSKCPTTYFENREGIKYI